jgi:hypothetical protein
MFESSLPREIFTCEIQKYLDLESKYKLKQTCHDMNNLINLNCHPVEEKRKKRLYQLKNFNPLFALAERHPEILTSVEIARNINTTFDHMITGLEKNWFEDDLYVEFTDIAWKYFSENPNLSWDIVKENRHIPWDFVALSSNPSITWDIIEQNPDEPWCYNTLMDRDTDYSSKSNNQYSNLTIKDIKNILNYFQDGEEWKLEWSYICSSAKLTYYDIINNEDLPWDYLALAENNLSTY